MSGRRGMVVGDETLEHTTDEIGYANALSLQLARPKSGDIRPIVTQTHHQLTQKCDVKAAVHSVGLAVEG